MLRSGLENNLFHAEAAAYHHADGAGLQRRIQRRQPTDRFYQELPHLPLPRLQRRPVGNGVTGGVAHCKRAFRAPVDMLLELVVDIVEVVAGGYCSKVCTLAIVLPPCEI